MNKKSFVMLAFGAVLSFCMVGTAAAQTSTAGMRALSLESVLTQPVDTKPENIDGTKVNDKTQQAAARISQDFQKAIHAGGADRGQIVVETINKMEQLYRGDAKNLFVRNFLGYLYLENREAERAIEVLVPAEGRSSSEVTNRAILTNLALAYYLTENYEKAGAAYGRLASIGGGSTAYRMAGSSYLLIQDPKSAIPYLEKAANANDLTPTQRASVMKDLGIAYSRVNQDADALRVFEELVKNNQADAEAMSWMGFAYLNQKRYDEAIRVLEGAKSSGAFNLAVWTNLANAYAAVGDDTSRGKAVQLYKQIAEKDPRNPVPFYNMGTQYMTMGLYSEAITALKKGVELAPTGPQAKFALNNIGFSYEKLGKYEDAADAYAKGSDMATNNEVFARNAGMAYYRAMKNEPAVKYLERAMANGSTSEGVALVLAESYSRSGKTADAMKLLKQLGDANPNSLNIWFNLGVLTYKSGDKVNAEKAYRKALDIKPDDTDTLNNLGVLLLETNRTDEALVLFEKMTGSAKGSIDGKLSMAAALLKAGRLADAVDIWKAVLNQDQSRNDVRLNLADGLWNLGMTKDARFHYATVLKNQPNNARALNGMGLWYLLQNDNRGAENALKRAIDSDSKYMPAYNNLAIALERLNRKAEAILILEKALKIDPAFKDARTNLDRLKSVTIQ